MTDTKYRVYTIEDNQGIVKVAIPEVNVSVFDAFLANPLENIDLETALNNCGAIQLI